MSKTTDQIIIDKAFADKELEANEDDYFKEEPMDEDDDSADEVYERERSDESYQQSSYGYLME